MAVHAVILMFKDHGKLNTVYGPPTLEEEIESETGGISISGEAATGAKS